MDIQNGMKCNLKSKKDYRQLVGTLFRNNQLDITSGYPTVNFRK